MSSQEKIISYAKHLKKIGRQSSDDMTRFELHHLAALIEKFMNRDLVTHMDLFDAVTDYLMSDDDSDGKKVLELIKDICIRENKESINTLLKTLPDFEEI